MDAIRAGVYTRAQLITMVGRQGLAELINARYARTLRRGWYQVGDAPQAVVTAVERGGVLSCVSALKHHGVWVPEHHDVHVRADSWATRNRKGPFCRQFGRPAPTVSAVDDLPTAIRHSARCLSSESLIVVGDSILNRGLMTWDQLEYQFCNAPTSVGRALERCDSRSESGPETMCRLRLAELRIPVQIQVQVTDIDRVDVLIGDWLIIEIDGWEYHGDWQSFQKDRGRDRRTCRIGYHTLRFTYDDIVFGWADSLADIQAAVDAGLHKRPNRRLA
ncbi:endonuclease domain-containing protein [Gordonia sp. (in: high G+C Gram-positive bacteria)]|uniref:endonuclease domain-containing protein n=1 Tax=Gordonia sp. (in: high G+C Gram-positive bacteria) TaxID=84139 RepID=UPI003F9C0B4D